MATVAVTSRSNRIQPDTFIFDDYVAAALTAAAKKKEWIVPFDCRIIDVIVHSNAAGSGGTSTIFDVNIDGTTIYTTQGNRPTLPLADDGMYTEAGEPEVTKMTAGDILSYDVDQITTTGPTETSISIVVVGR